MVRKLALAFIALVVILNVVIAIIALSSSSDRDLSIPNTVADFDGEVSVANSPSLLGWPDLHAKLDELCTAGRLWIRPGLSLYGISPFADRVGSDLGLEAAMQFEATLMAVKRLRAGSPVGYGGTWTSERASPAFSARGTPTS